MKLECKKCGSEDISVKYDDGKTTTSEHLSCTCNRCKHHWRNSTKEQQERAKIAQAFQ